MRPGLAWLVVGSLLLGACDTTTAPTTTIPPLPPPDPQVVTTTTTAAILPTGPASFTHDGFLPDGTRYVLHVEGLDVGLPTGASAGIVIDIDGSPNAIGITQFFAHGTIAEYSFDDGLYRIPGTGGAQIDFYDHVLDALGPDAEEVIRSSIREHPLGFPVLELLPPFRWATDDDLPLEMEVHYQDFVVRRGCGGLAAACSTNHAIQVIPNDSASLPGSVWADLQVFIESTGRRPVSDPNYLDPGPLSPRTIPDVLWNGEEMIIWGGGQSGEPYLIDGARFNPDTTVWNLLPPIPLSQEQPTRSIVLGGSLLVVSEEATFVFSPSGDWGRFADGITPPRDPGFLALVDDKVYLWNTSGIFALDAASGGEWAQVPDPPFDLGNAAHGDRWFSAMVSSGDSLYLSLRSDDGCAPRDFARWDGVSWRKLPSVSLATTELADCSFGNQMAVTPEGLVIWDAGHPTMVYTLDEDSWHSLDPIPVGGTEGPPGGVGLETGVFMVPQDRMAAFFDGFSETWSALSLPGYGDDTTIVWTGSEFLSWSADDAWRWTPDFEG